MLKKDNFTFLVLLLLFAYLAFFSNSFIYSEDVIKPKGEFKVIKGLGKSPNREELSSIQQLLMARRAAIIDAYRNALIYLKKYDEKKWETKPYQTIQISGKIKAAKIIDTKYLSDGSVKVKIKIPKKEDK